MAIIGRSLRVMVGDQDISGIVRRITIEVPTGDVVTATLELIGNPTLADGVLQLDSARRTHTSTSTDDLPLRSTRLRDDTPVETP